MRYSLFLLLLCTAAHADAIRPRTLWNLVSEADVIVVAQVTSVDEVPRGAANLSRLETSHVANLKVERALKGNPDRFVAVGFDAKVICPAPEVYTPGRQVLAFLRRDAHGHWFTNAHAYGTRYPTTPQELEALERLVHKAKELGAATAAEPPPPVSWRLEAAATRATRWDGLYAVTPTEAEAFDDTTLAELERIAIQTPSYDATLVSMLTLLAQRKNAEVTASTANAIEAVVQQHEPPLWLDDAIDLFEARLTMTKPRPQKRESLTSPTRPYEELRKERDAAIQQRWKTLKKRFKLTPHVPADFVKFEGPLTGGETPR